MVLEGVQLPRRLSKLNECCDHDEWPVRGGCAAATGSQLKVRSGPRATPNILSPLVKIALHSGIASSPGQILGSPSYFEF